MVTVRSDVVYDSIMISVFFVISGALSAYLLYYYSRKKKLPWYIYIVVGFTYWITFGAIFLVTIDIASGLHITTEPHEASTYMRIIWNVIYWSIQILSWILIPILQSYVLQGHFTWYRKLLGAIIENIILYIIFGVIGAVVLVGIIVYIVMHATQDTPFTANSIFGLCISLSNAFGLTLLVFLLGFGMAELPKYLWKRARHAYTLALYQFRSNELFDNVQSKKSKYKNLLEQVIHADQQVPVNVAERKYIDKMSTNVAMDVVALKVNVRKAMNAPSKSVIKNPDLVTYRQCVKLNQKLIKTRLTYQKYAYQWEYLQRKAFHLEAVMDAKTQRHGEYRIIDPFRRERSHFLAKFFDFIEYFWTTRLHFWIYRILCVVIFLFSIVLVWCEFTPLFRQILIDWLGTNVNLSPFYHLIRAFRFSRFLLQMISLLIISLISFMMYFGLFKLRFFSLYQLIPHHSDAATLLFTAVFLTRVVPALCYNYLQITGVTEQDGVAFFEVMGALRLEELSFLGFLGGAFQDYFPLIMILVAILVYADLVSRIASLCGFHRFAFNEKLSTERIEEGRSFLATQKKYKLQRLSERDRIKSSRLREAMHLTSMMSGSDEESGVPDIGDEDDEDLFATHPLPSTPTTPTRTAFSSLTNRVRSFFGGSRRTSSFKSPDLDAPSRENDDNVELR